MKKQSIYLLLLTLAMNGTSFAAGNESNSWLGQSRSENWNIELLITLNSIGNSTSASTLVGGIAYKFLDQGFLPQINNQLFLEGQFGRSVKASSEYFFSTHFRWDLEPNKHFTYFALLGFIGSLKFNSDTGSIYYISIKTGIGMIYYPIEEKFGLRLERSTDVTAFGVVFTF